MGSTQSFPNTGRVLAQFVRQAKQAFRFTAIMLLKDIIKTQMPQDSRNAPYPNLVAPIGLSRSFIRIAGGRASSEELPDAS